MTVILYNSKSKLAGIAWAGQASQDHPSKAQDFGIICVECKVVILTLTV